ENVCKCMGWVANRRATKNIWDCTANLNSRRNMFDSNRKEFVMFRPEIFAMLAFRWPKFESGTKDVYETLIKCASQCNLHVLLRLTASTDFEKDCQDFAVVAVAKRHRISAVPSSGRTRKSNCHQLSYPTVWAYAAIAVALLRIA